MTGYRPPAPIPNPNPQGKIETYIKASRCPISALTEKNYRMKAMKVALPHRSFFLINDPKEIDTVFGNADRFPKSTVVSDLLELLLGDSIFVSNGETWKRQRRMMAPAFELARLKPVFPLMLAAAEDSAKRLSQSDPNKPFAIDVEMTHFTADIIFRTIFSRPLNADEAYVIFDAFQRFQNEIYPYGGRRMLGLPRFLSYFRLKRCAKAAREIRGILDSIVKARYDAAQKGDKGPDDILASLIAARDEKDGSAFDLRELCEQVAMLFLAGHETSSSALSWALYLIATAPGIQDRLYEEAVRVMGARPPQFKDMKRLNLSRNIFRETLRLYPPVSFISRDLREPFEFRGFVAKTRDMVMVAPWVLHRHRLHWSEPDIFDPDRFDREDSEQAQRDAYMPFGQGPRVCLGAAFALQEGTLILANLVRQFRFEAVPGLVPTPVGRLTVRAEGGIRLKVFPR